MMTLEKPEVIQVEHKDLEQLKGQTAERLWNVTMNLQILSSKAYKMAARAELDALLNESWEEFDLRHRHPDPDDNPWDFWGSFFYCFTVYSTTGE